MISNITLQSLTEKAYSIHSCLKDGQFDHVQATQGADNLYQEGVQLAIAEVNLKPIFKDIVSPVICRLNEIVSLEDTQHLASFHRSLSKVYRLFIEITWYQCLCQGSLPTLNKTRDSIITNSRSIQSILPKKEIGARFEYRCAEQAAKCLTVAKSIGKKFPDLVLNIGESAEKASFFGIIKGFQGLIKDARNDWVHEWYLYIHELRWLSTNIKTQEDFKNIIEVRLKNFHEQGKKYTVCLATIFVDLIKNKDPKVSDHVRMSAAEGLADLFGLKVSIFENKKRYRKTRSLIMQSLEELAKDSTYEKYIRKILPTLIKAADTSKHKMEKQKIRETVGKIQDRIKSVQDIIEEDEAVIEANKENQRNGEDIQKLNDKFEKDKEEKQTLENHLEKMNLAEKALEDLHQEEEEYKNRLEAILNSYN
ncbi:hypothetical protein [Candidatus Protochlamydia sp. W-9]|uniref:hypothetical protein n=1 Tax=Candidatus Protochlamydia sp. W-9 TaxID=1785087 RepID=UPI00096A54F2|nr:hypothetical protein [Candidatus Protochlamydia sp. W-9]